MAQTSEQRRASAKRTRLWTLYRITPEEAAVVESFQRGHFEDLLTKGDPSETANLYNDHRHSDGLYRGKLAYLINKALGVLEGAYKERTPHILRSLARYLESPPATLVLGKPRYGMIGKAKLNKKVKIYGSPKGPIKAPKKEKKA